MFTKLFRGTDFSNPKLAIVTGANEDGTVNVAAFDNFGTQLAFQNVPVLSASEIEESDYYFFVADEAPTIKAKAVEVAEPAAETAPATEPTPV